MVSPRKKTGPRQRVVAESLRPPPVPSVPPIAQVEAAWAPIGSVTEWAGNPRKNQPVDEVAASIKRFGWGEPAIARSANRELLAGHTRVKAARKLVRLWKSAKDREDWHPDAVRVATRGEVLVRLVDLSEQDGHAFALAANRLGELAAWNQEMLRDALKGMPTDLKKLAGYNEVLLRTLATGLEGDDEPVVVPDGDPESHLGDLLILGDHRLVCGDCTDPEVVAYLLDGQKPEMMVTDPPYGVNYDGDWRSKVRPGKVSNDHTAMWGAAWALFPGSIAYVWCASLFTHVVAADLIASGFELRTQIIWAKDALVMSRGAYHWQHEPCWYAVRKGKTARWGGDRTQSSLWQIKGINRAGEDETIHSTQKPVECMLRPMRNHKVDTVYDPFLGSGTSIIAAERAGRKAFAIELDPKYVDVAVGRWEKLTGGKAERIRR